MEKVEELHLPNSIIMKILKDTIPEGVSISKEARSACSRAASVFILYLTSCANNLAVKSKKKTMTGSDVIQALVEMEYEELIEPVQKAFEAYNQEKNKKDSNLSAAKAKKKDEAGSAQDSDASPIKEDIPKPTEENNTASEENDISSAEEDTEPAEEEASAAQEEAYNEEKSKKHSNLIAEEAKKKDDAGSVQDSDASAVEEDIPKSAEEDNTSSEDDSIDSVEADVESPKEETSVAQEEGSESIEDNSGIKSHGDPGCFEESIKLPECANEVEENIQCV